MNTMEWLSHRATIGGATLAAKTKTVRKTKAKRKPKGAGVNMQLVKALAHELRVEILTILNERMASPNELAKELDEGLSQVSYHVKVLKDYECIQLVKTEPRRGAVEHYYRATSRAFLTDRDWHELPDSVRPGLSADLLELIRGDAVWALEEGTFDAREDRHMSRTPLILDEEGWGEVLDLMEDALSGIVRTQKKAATRLAKSGEEGFSATVAMMGFELPEAPSQRRRVPKGKAKGKAKAGTKAKGKAKAKAKK
jgi:DNA-binding transcriptional ArsR family regulator